MTANSRILPLLSALLSALLGFCLFGGLAQAGPLSATTGSTQDFRAVPVQAPAEPEGYRMGRYRAPTPATLRGATAIATEAAQRLWRSSSAIFIDVLPRPPKPKDLPEDVVWRDRPRHDIPGSVWLPNVGFGALSPEVEAYFADNLERLTEGDRNAPMVIYCLAQCWMSWNAAKRALSYGYTRVYWYPDGTDAWRAAGGELQEVTPVPLEP